MQPTIWLPILANGTTGRSKGIMLSHNLLSNALVLKDYWGWIPGDINDPHVADFRNAYWLVHWHWCAHQR
jgi:acyl-CoA synthetase (AMP-forming)/AMP-acid ligase II